MSAFVIVVCQGDQRPTRDDVAKADLILKVTPHGNRTRVRVLAAPGLPMRGGRPRVIDASSGDR